MTVPTEGDAQVSGKIPLLHITDLYHPPQDPDDQLDLATWKASPDVLIDGLPDPLRAWFAYGFAALP